MHTFAIIITVKTPIHYKFFATPIVKNTFSLEDSRSDLAVFLFCLFIVQTSVQECSGILVARCASCNCMTYFNCAPL
ncbi:hypothetical protein DXB15_13260 [Roseburia sp. OM02-15]|nr:hypothetical protein DXB15_13260 [Roseburia sp. OM02-15]